ncbi:hypothetical protein PGTUg99_031776 [Puccinia graminis f. sp. tritici]|uniref:Uncharacterized protein n=1 Tax=Puccinia graminis f. sp. tritici TaxID=56615 RepID=A0A5B0Q4A3_PUCGR|nr:hypothetical protein PGTUg99_031776 [Puccinia graminis f. sp. tritici]
MIGQFQNFQVLKLCDCSTQQRFNPTLRNPSFGPYHPSLLHPNQTRKGSPSQLTLTDTGLVDSQQHRPDSDLPVNSPALPASCSSVQHHCRPGTNIPHHL